MEILVRIPRVVTLYGYFAVKMVLTGDEILQCDHSDKSYWAVLCCGCLYYDVQDNTNNFWVCELNPKVWPFKWSFRALFSCCSVYYALLYRLECFTGKYTTRKIHKKYIQDPSGLFSIISHRRYRWRNFGNCPLFFTPPCNILYV